MRSIARRTRRRSARSTPGSQRRSGCIPSWPASASRRRSRHAARSHPPSTAATWTQPRPASAIPSTSRSTTAAPCSISATATPSKATARSQARGSRCRCVDTNDWRLVHWTLASGAVTYSIRASGWGTRWSTPARSSGCATPTSRRLDLHHRRRRRKQRLPIARVEVRASAALRQARRRDPRERERPTEI